MLRLLPEMLSNIAIELIGSGLAKRYDEALVGDAKPAKLELLDKGLALRAWAGSPIAATARKPSSASEAWVPPRLKSMVMVRLSSCANMELAVAGRIGVKAERDGDW